MRKLAITLLCAVLGASQAQAYTVKGPAPIYRQSVDIALADFIGESFESVLPVPTTSSSAMTQISSEELQGERKPVPVESMKVTCNGADTCDDTATCNGVDTCNGKVSCNGADTCDGTTTCNGADTCNGTTTCNGIDTCDGYVTCNGVQTCTGKSTCSNTCTGFDTCASGCQSAVAHQSEEHEPDSHSSHLLDLFNAALLAAGCVAGSRMYGLA